MKTNIKKMWVGYWENRKDTSLGRDILFIALILGIIFLFAALFPQGLKY